MAEADPKVVEGQAPEAPSSEPYTGFGAGMMETRVDEPPEAIEGHPDEASSQEAAKSAAEPKEEAPDPEEQERGYLRHADYTKAKMELAEQRKQIAAERAQEKQEMEQRIRQLEQLARPQQAQPQPQDAMGQYVAALQHRIADPNVTPEVRVNAQWELQGIQAVQASIQQAIESAVGPLKQGLEALPTLQQQLQGYTKAQQQEQMQILQEQRKAAIEAYGEEMYNAWAPKIAGLVVQNGRYTPVADPLTGDPMTLAELIGRLSGKKAAQQLEVQGQTRQARAATKQQAATMGVSPAIDAQNGHLTEEEAKEIIRRTMPR